MLSGVVLMCCLAAGVASEPVAVTDAGNVTVADVDREMEYMAGRERRYRQEMAIPSSTTHRDVIERIALRVIAVAQAEADGLDRDLLTLEQTREAGRRWLLGLWQKNRWGLDDSKWPSRVEVTKELEGTIPSPPDRIRLSHIFLPAASDDARVEAEELMKQWRLEIKSLEEFRKVAHQHSASQDRDRGGQMGWLQRGFLAEGLEQTLFALAAGSISPPLYFDGGMHLFFVEQVEIDRAARLEERVAAEIKRRLGDLVDRQRADLVARARSRLIVGVDHHESSRWPDVSVGQHMVSGAVLEALSGPQADIEATVQGWIEDELLYQTALESDWITAEQRDRIDDLSAQVLHENAAAKWASEHISQPSKESVNRLIQSEPQRFRYRLRMQVRAVSIELLGLESPRAVARQFKSMVEAMQAGTLLWDDAVKACSSTTEVVDLPLATDLDLAGVLGPRVFKAIAGTARGSVHGPIQSEGRLWVVQVVDRKEPGPLAREEAEPKARRILLSRRASELGREFGDARLNDHGFQLTELGMTMTGGTAGSPPAMEQP